ncbi:MAG: spermidine/putrescine ABC transporter substrate-binding protein [Brevibacterium sp.]|uniref:polyamine ABC transporter substrate-binding protein n=1 Tax=Brevibacterium sp. TaxID=1701 RepID=UPI002649DF37|nr:spermidine/putrescine ABC transporter substrate-binding protein [Brevibacterium sp.]MDN5808308.1 spermidine/putrescine ABC transporter substrate-binding protein [Brevibacterium sp.]MDN5833933.1 spermidine/putrescine ABC transporter substrate-binding protein [Brevibacterium sp.]MDN5876598.1 spermidine/putrescine ABC transporter substrate-binding protein [Brevibacterium sp.]MDN5910479.1 spermidine/putrescine ABC transporter substrate-binding protein [Brevibacterium sp.]MDN6132657.1 spermidine
MSEPSPINVLAPNHKVDTITRRAALAGFGVLGLGALTACGRNTTMAASPPVDGTIESKLNLYTWGDYDSPDLLGKFRDDFDVLLQVDSYGSNEELIAKLSSSRGTSGYDVVVPTGSQIDRFAGHDLLQPLDLSLIPNFSHMDPNFTDQEFDPGNKYTICKAWGTTGYAYRTDVISREMNSWQDFIDAAGDEASGRTSLLSDPWELTAISLATLGYSLNTTDDKELEEAKKIIIDEIAPHVRAYFGSASTGMIQGSFDLMQSYNGDARQGFNEVENPDDWEYVFPTPSANLWMDCWAIATGAPHPDAAHEFINFMISPENSMPQIEYIGYPIGVKGSEKKARKAKFDNIDLIFPDQKVLDRLEASIFNEGMAARVDILTEAKRRSGAA